ncbi:MAG: nucleotidyltransferase family protein [Candidatus Aminicenantes bacterium]|nr:nucleotidyltransferase family protein [Candidatus Aminicenantes bacterium]
MEKMAKELSRSVFIGFLRDSKKFLTAEFGVREIALFGSWVNGNQKPGSDLDLLVELKPEYKTFDNYMNLKFFFEDHFKIEVDLVLKDSIRPELKKTILAEAVHA